MSIAKKTNKKVIILCPNCKKDFTINQCYAGRYIYCSMKCKKDFFRKDIDVKDVIDMYVNKKLGIPTIKNKYKIGQCLITSILKDNNIGLRDKTWVLYNRPPFKGHNFTQEEKKDISCKASQAYINDPTLKDRIRQKTLEQINSGKMSKSNTSIEKIVFNLLTKMGISFEYQKIFAFWCFDFYLPDYNLFIECDGDYWHGHPNIYGRGKKILNKIQKNNIKRGKQKEFYVKNCGYNLIRFWETDINKNIKQVEKILCNIQKTF